MKKLIFNEECKQDDEAWEYQQTINDEMEDLNKAKKDFDNLGFNLTLREVSDWWDLYSDHLCAGFLGYYPGTIESYLYEVEDKDTYQIIDEDKDILMKIKYIKGKYPYNIKLMPNIEVNCMKNVIQHEKTGYKDDTDVRVIYTYDREKGMDILRKDYYDYCDNIFTYDMICKIKHELYIRGVDTSISFIKTFLNMYRNITDFRNILKTDSEIFGFKYEIERSSANMKKDYNINCNMIQSMLIIQCILYTYKKNTQLSIIK